MKWRWYKTQAIRNHSTAARNRQSTSWVINWQSRWRWISKLAMQLVRRRKWGRARTLPADHRRSQWWRRLPPGRQIRKIVMPRTALCRQNKKIQRSKKWKRRRQRPKKPKRKRNRPLLKANQSSTSRNHSRRRRWSAILICLEGVSPTITVTKSVRCSNSMPRKMLIIWIWAIIRLLILASSNYAKRWPRRRSHGSSSPAINWRTIVASRWQACLWETSTWPFWTCRTIKLRAASPKTN